MTDKECFEQLFNEKPIEHKGIYTYIISSGRIDRINIMLKFQFDKDGSLLRDKVSMMYDF